MEDDSRRSWIQCLRGTRPNAGDPEGVEDTANLVNRGRHAYSTSAWADAYASLSTADEAAPLAAEDLELLATSAYMLGRDDEWMRALERAHHGYLDARTAARASVARSGSGSTSRSTERWRAAAGWLGRAHRLLERDRADCVEHGYLLLPVMFQHEAAGDFDGAAATAASAAEIGERFADADLFALAIHEHGNILIKHGQVKEGLGLLDEAMVAVTAGELSPDRHRSRLLRRDRELPARCTSCAAPRSGPPP